MALKVALVMDNIRKNGALVPRVAHRNKVGFDKLLSFMDKTTGLSESDLRSVFHQLAEALVFYLPDGSEVQTPIGAIKLSVHYPCIESDRSLPTRDRKISTDDMRMQIRGDRSLLERIRLESSINVVDAPAPLIPSIIRVENADMAGWLDSGSAGHILHITGSRLHFDKNDNDQGVFLIGTSASPAATRIAVYSRIGSNIVDGKIPNLDAGGYRLEVRTRPSGRDIRQGYYERTIAIS
ncbi:MAG: DUF4469 domain-containing protein [Rectinemataceae bacterium]|jgi:hypothetical protein